MQLSDLDSLLRQADEEGQGHTAVDRSGRDDLSLDDWPGGFP